jgi:peroxiredoxin
MTTLAESLSNPSRARLQAGEAFPLREVTTLDGARARIPDPQRLVHLQLRRYAGCPICSLHLRTFVRRKDELDGANVREVIVFHSPAAELRKVHSQLPFDLVPDPSRRLYDALGLTRSARALLDPRAWSAVARAVLTGASADPSAGVGDGSLGLPGDFLIARDGRIVAVKYGVHADDQWSIDELLALVTGAG